MSPVFATLYAMISKVETYFAGVDVDMMETLGEEVPMTADGEEPPEPEAYGTLLAIGSEKMRWSFLKKGSLIYIAVTKLDESVSNLRK